MRSLALDILPQPDETTCGPTCLHAVYRHYGHSISLPDVIAEVRSLAAGGTLAVMLACHALARGYRATIYTYNLQLFDPSWFVPEPVDLGQKLRQQLKYKRSDRLRVATTAYLEFLDLGGVLRFEPLSRRLIHRLVGAEHPVLTGLSATYLYQEPRELPTTSQPDDIRGVSTGHFVILCGYDPQTEQVMVADPLQPNPLSTTRYYTIGVDTVMGAILLGVMTYDANLLVLEPTAAPS